MWLLSAEKILTPARVAVLESSAARRVWGHRGGFGNCPSIAVGARFQTGFRCRTRRRCIGRILLKLRNGWNSRRILVTIHLNPKIDCLICKFLAEVRVVTNYQASPSGNKQTGSYCRRNIIAGKDIDSLRSINIFDRFSDDIALLIRGEHRACFAGQPAACMCVGSAHVNAVWGLLRKYVDLRVWHSWSFHRNRHASK